jgi:hypothetical protein
VSIHSQAGLTICCCNYHDRVRWKYYLLKFCTYRDSDNTLLPKFPPLLASTRSFSLSSIYITTSTHMPNYIAIIQCGNYSPQNCYYDSIAFSISYLTHSDLCPNRFCLSKLRSTEKYPSAFSAAFQHRLHFLSSLHIQCLFASQMKTSIL